MLANIDVSTMLIKTERLILRPLMESDLSDFKELIIKNGLDKNWDENDKSAKYYTTLIKTIQSKDTIALMLKESYKIIGSILFGSLLGDEELINSQLKGRGIGFMLTENLRGKGLMTEAVQAIIKYCFQNSNYDFLMCAYKEPNLQSKRVIEKCGFKYYTTQVDSEYVLNIIQNTF